MRLTKTLAWSFAFLFFIYILYVVGVVVFLNTPLFSKVASMEDDEQTYVRFKGAFSLFPGHLYSSSARVFIGDQNVSIGIDVSGIHARFRLKPLLQKKFIVRTLVIDRAEVDVGLKTPKQTEAFVRKYTKAESLDYERRLRLTEERARSRLTLDFPSITIRKIAHVRGGFGTFAGEMSLQGGFLIQPKVQVEVYPTTLRFLSGIVGRADVRFERFKTVEAPGNAVFPFVNANFDFKVDTDSFSRFDYKLQSLPGYSLDNVGSNAAVKIKIEKGILQKGSYIESLATRMTIRAQRLSGTGVGHVKWEVDRKDSSRLRGRLKNLKLSQTKSPDKGRLDSADLDVRLYGNRLVAAFNGLSLLLKLRGLDWRMQSGSGKNRNLDYRAQVKGNGVIAAYTGDLPARARKDPRLRTQLTLTLSQLLARTSFAGKITGTGSLELKSGAFDLARPTTHYPEVRGHLDLQLGEHGRVITQAVLTQVEHQSAPLDSWKAKLHWKLDRTEPFIEAIQHETQLSSTVQSLAKVRNLELFADCEFNEDGSLFRFNQIKSDGSWKGYGTLRNGPDGMNGLFELSLLSVPIGVWIRPESTEVQFMPAQAWYDRTLAAPLTGSPRQPESGARGTR